MLAKFKRKLIWNLLKLPLPDKWMLSLRYYQFSGKWMDWRHPRNFTEKIQYLKRYDRRPECVLQADKCAVKNWVAEKIGPAYVVPTYGVWEKVEDINFDTLPDRFVLKCNHDSGSAVICTDKASFDRTSAGQKLKAALQRDFSRSGGEWVYKHIPRRVFAEQYLDARDSGGLMDYKFFCFNGVPQYIYVTAGMSDHATARLTYFYPDWSPAPFLRNDFPPFESVPPKPACLDEMLRLCRVLSEGHPFVRVDLYWVNGQIYFSEMTFYPTGGYIPFLTEEMDEAAGAYLKLPQQEQ